MEPSKNKMEKKADRNVRPSANFVDQNVFHIKSNLLNTDVVSDPSELGVSLRPSEKENSARKANKSTPKNAQKNAMKNLALRIKQKIYFTTKHLHA